MWLTNKEVYQRLGSKIKHNHQWKYDQSIRKRLWTSFFKAWKHSRGMFLDRLQFWGRWVLTFLLGTALPLYLLNKLPTGVSSLGLAVITTITVVLILTWFILDLITRYHVFYSMKHIIVNKKSRDWIWSYHYDSGGNDPFGDVMVPATMTFAFVWCFFALSLPTPILGNTLQRFAFWLLFLVLLILNAYILSTFRTWKFFYPFKGNNLIPGTWSFFYPFNRKLLPEESSIFQIQDYYQAHPTSEGEIFIDWTNPESDGQRTDEPLVDPITLDRYTQKEIFNINGMSAADQDLFVQKISPLENRLDADRKFMQPKTFATYKLIIKYVRTNPKLLPDLLSVINEMTTVTKLIDSYQELRDQSDDMPSEEEKKLLKQINDQQRSSSIIIKNVYTKIKSQQKNQVIKLLNLDRQLQTNLTK